jgi:hypothetical protein
MPHRLYILLCCCFMGAIAAPRLQAQSDTLTANAQINLITADPGTEIYSYFGHSALQVRDTTLGIDRVFNYGTFDFNTPNFYGKFVQGRLNYKLSAAQFEPFLENYIEDNRSLYSQTLNLTPAETQTLYRLLLTNYKPENREYLYDFFFDNCATRIRDIIEKTLPNRLHYDSTEIDKPLTFRQLVNIYTHQNKWLDFGIDLILGAKTDRIAQPREYMFLPDYLKIAFDKAKIDSNGTRIPLVKSSETLFKATPIAETHGIGAIVGTPQSLFAILCVVGIFASIIAQRRGQLLAWLDNLWLSILGILGILLLFFWFGTDHKVLVNNYNLLWAMPLHLPFLWFRTKLSAVQQRYYWIFTDILLLLAVFIALFQKPQGLHAAIMPLCCLFIFRCGINIAATYPLQKAQH